MSIASMRFMLRSTAVVFGLAWGAMTPAFAQTNLGFESSPDFTGYSTQGGTFIKTSAYGSGPTEGGNDALLTTDNTFTSVASSTLENFLGLASGKLTSLGAEGAAIKQTFNATAGQVVTFDWDFLTNQKDPTLTSHKNHVSFVSEAGTVTVLADVNTGTFLAGGSPTPDFLDETGFSTSSFTVASTGPLTLGFGVLDTSTSDVPSGLLIDNIRISGATPNVPEPGTLALCASLGMGSVAGFLRRRRTRK